MALPVEGQTENTIENLKKLSKCFENQNTTKLPSKKCLVIVIDGKIHYL
jgi:hypothetical protein